MTGLLRRSRRHCAVQSRRIQRGAGGRARNFNCAAPTSTAASLIVPPFTPQLFERFFCPLRRHCAEGIR
jgi:hypothetical protein